MKTKSKKLKIVLKYIKKGYKVIFLNWVTKEGKCSCGKDDCNSIAKHPLEKGWRESATTDKSEICRMLAKYPKANIGIVTEKDFIVLDVDGKEGRKALAELKKQHGKLPITVTSITGKGLHYWFTTPVSVKNSTSKVGIQIDVRGDGGYIVAPPSTHHSGNTYRFKEGQGLDDVEIAEVPEWLLGLMLADKQKSSLNTGNARNLPVKLTNSSVIPSGQRNDTLFKFGCYLRSKGHESETIYSQLTKMNTEQCQPPLDSSEIETIINSCMRYSPGGLQESLQYTNEWLTKNSDVDFDKILSDDNLIKSLAVLSKEDAQQFAQAILLLKKQGLSSRNEAELRKIVNVTKNELKNNAVLMQPDIGIPITAFFDNPPVPLTTLIPAGYEIDFNGVRIVITGKNIINKTVSTSPILLKYYFKNMTDGTEYATLIWHKNSTWEAETVPRIYIADTQKIVSLASKGFPVTSSNARDLVGFLYLLESINLDNIPKAEITSQIGWVGEKGEKGFLFGLKYIASDGKGALMNANLKLLDKKPLHSNSIFFYNSDNGEYRFADALCFGGDYKKWVEIVKIINKNPIIAFFIYATLAAPLLKILDQPNFIVDLSGVTTSGKTTAMKVAASVWGNPNLIIRTWNNTQVYLERTASMHVGLPIFLDDTKLIKDKDTISKVIYEGTAGQGRGRGTIFGTAPIPKWNTVILSTGESSILNLTNKSDGGAHGRVIAICSPPFPDKNVKNMRIIKKLDSITSENYGYAGIKYIRYLLKNIEQLSQWKTELAEIKKIYDDKESTSIMNRLHGYFACIHLAAKLFSEACPDCELDFESHINNVYELVAKEVEKSADAGKSALKDLYEYCVSHQADFYDKNDTDKHQPARGWLGVWENECAVIPAMLSEILTKNGYEPKAIIRDWNQKGWLTKDKSGDNPKFTIGNARIRCYAIKPEVLDKLNSNTL